MLIAEQLYLLLYDDHGFGTGYGRFNDAGVAAGVMADLSLGYGALQYSDNRARRVRVIAGLPPNAHPALVAAHSKILEKPDRRAEDWMSRGNIGKREDVTVGLVHRGVLIPEFSKGIFLSSTYYRTRDASVEKQLRARLQAVMFGHKQAALDEAVVLLALDALWSVRGILKAELTGMPRGESRARIRELREKATDPAYGWVDPLLGHSLKACMKSLRQAQNNHGASA
ncbi:hypothetical protein CGLAU_11200 [Corynebacterium glaucum]|uniref:Golgi phosphoprotein 3 (GPP34) n=1 Tax=Corynebacterium glaucum TaxID=187491 RepID=A0A1Q2HZA2_9CORY|nr:GPP34 family phosphoprotein [Corynebacterium glaucum]AQQ16172.1 hypothetical protein CGLAU_11200 [Corynebacterium glaucum]